MFTAQMILEKRLTRIDKLTLALRAMRPSRRARDVRLKNRLIAELRLLGAVPVEGIDSLDILHR
jgi:hypothetical protein